MSLPRILFPLLCLCLSACAHYPVNPPLLDDQVKNLPVDRQRGDESLLVVVTFSGGGTRAAALAYGAMQALAETSLPGERRLLDEVDLISAVSGGSFTAAYYGLHGDGLFAEFESRLLKRDFQTAILSRIVIPKYWPELLSENYGRSELAADYLDEHLFDHAVLGDMRSDGPTVQINATDVSRVRQFAFSPQQFALICSDYSQFPVSRAVAASSAIPLIATSVVLHNRAGQCGTTAPDWTDPLRRNLDEDLRLKEEALQLNSYLDSRERPFMHLLDGGLAGNLGLRGAMERVGLTDDPLMRAESPWLRGTRRVVFIVINAETPPKEKVDRVSHPLALGATAEAASDVPILRYNVETRLLLRERLSTWQRLQRTACKRSGRKDCSDIATHMVEVSLDQISDPIRRRQMQSVPTRMGLQSTVVDELIAEGAALLRQHPSFQAMLQDLRGVQ